MDAKEQSKVTGLGGTPSLGVAPWEDLASVIAEVQNTANIVLTNSKYTKGDWGDGAAGRTNVIYRKGDLEVGGNLSELLMTVAETMTARERLRRDVAALTAEGKMSAIVLAALPILLGFAMWGLNPEYIETLFTDGLGKILVRQVVVAGFTTKCFHVDGLRFFGEIGEHGDSLVIKLSDPS